MHEPSPPIFGISLTQKQTKCVLMEIAIKENTLLDFFTCFHDSISFIDVNK